MLTNPLSFSDLTEFETTKHVHRLHPYRGKFIPHLPEYLLKKYFKQDDIILDPFCGSGTTLVQCAEMGIHAVGIDVSEFAVFMANVKIGDYDRKDVVKEIKKITEKLPVGADLPVRPMGQTRWSVPTNENNQKEIQFIFCEIKKIPNPNTRKFLALVLSRVINVKSETHPEIIYWWKKYSIDSLNRMIEFQKLKTDSYQLAISGDSRNIDLLKKIEKRNKNLAELIQTKKIKGIVTSPPYVGVINYHEEHKSSYDIFGFNRNDDFEIGPKSKGESKIAREEYSRGIAEAFLNLRKYLADDFDIFLIVNDKFNLYPFIAKESGLRIIEKFSRPVLNRTRGNTTPYSEYIYHLRSICHSRENGKSES
jgi:DNA modification methylase